MRRIWTYLDISDATKLIYFIIDKKLFKNKTYNAVTTNASVREIVEIISKQISNVNIEFIESKIMNQLSYHVLARRIERLGFKFQGDLPNGIKETLEQLQGIRNRLPIHIIVK